MHITTNNQSNIGPWGKKQTMIRRAYLNSPSHNQLITMHTHSADCVEFTVHRLDGTKAMDRWLPYAEAVNYRAKLIHQGWTEATAPERF